MTTLQIFWYLLACYAEAWGEWSITDEVIVACDKAAHYIVLA